MCVCMRNYTGEGTPPDPCGTSVIGDGFTSYGALAASECTNHCNTEIRSGLCAGHGISSCTAHELYGWNGTMHPYPAYSGTVAYGCNSHPSVLPFRYRDFDAHITGSTRVKCRCDPGWGTESTNLCALRIRDAVCSGHGRDASGLEAGEGTCNQFPYFHSSCGTGYPSDIEITSLGGPDCSCDPGWVGGSPNKCSLTVRGAYCSGHGQGSCPSCRILSNDTNPITCQCDPESGWATLGGNSTQQCAHFAACITYGCGDNGNCTTTGTGCSADAFNPNGRCCTCDAGYGGATCCPLRHGSTTVLCNDLGTCGEDGKCTCHPGTEPPGCCLACQSPEQTCLPDGRCSCPVINGTACGTRGSTCDQADQICTCSSFPYYSARFNQSYTIQTGGLFCCPRSTANGMLCGGKGTCHAAQHPDLVGTGGCQCSNTSFAGPFCCPIAAGQTDACGINGECMPDGSCRCDPGVTGSACEINYNCNPSDTLNECSRGGVCTRLTQGNYGLGDYLEYLRYDNHPNQIYVCQDGSGNFTDEGLVFFIQDFWMFWMGIDLTQQSPEAAYYTQNVTACAEGTPTGRGQCLLNVLQACLSQLETFISTNFAGTYPYVTNYVFPRTHPSRAVNTAPFFLQAAQALASNACQTVNTTLKKEAMAAIMVYEMYYQKTPQPVTPPGQAQLNINSISLLPTQFTGYPYQCKCTAPPPGSIIGFQTAAGGTKCQLQCLVGGKPGEGTLQVCSGNIHGEPRGYCADQFGNPDGTGTLTYDPNNPVPIPGTCVCNPRFAGSACQYERSPGCIPLSHITDTPCTSAQRGTCLQTTDLDDEPVFSCNCSIQYTGTYCELTRCQPPSQLPTEIECNNRGVCLVQGGQFQCDCSDFNNGPQVQTGSGNIVPFMAGGLACEVNVTANCGTFRSNLIGGGTWEICSGAGSCVVSYTLPPFPQCVCMSGRGGNKCQDTACNPACNSTRQLCSNSTGQCGCKPFWGDPPGGCPPDDRNCQCSVNECIHGTPNFAGDDCTCQPGWKKVPFGHTGVSGGGAGSCDIVQCPLVVHNDQGIRLCNEPADPRCPDLSSITQSLATGCCVDSCPQCNLVGSDRVCDCGVGHGNPNCFIAQQGACFPKCHGNDEALVNPPNCISPGPPPVCNCAAVNLQSNQFVDTTCLRYTCVHGTRLGTSCIPQQSQCCDCTGTAFTGSLCSEVNCQGRGTPNANGTFCVCYEPFYRGPGRSDCNLNRCTPGTVTGFTPNFLCNCPSTTIIGAGSLSCITLNCSTIHAAQCASCVHGTPSIQNFAFICDCTGTPYTGVNCNTAVCQNGGFPKNPPDQTNCTCPFPYSGQFCVQNQCLNGGTPGSGVCNCPTGYSGTRCEVHPSSSSSSTGSGTSSSSSSTGSPGPTPSTGTTPASSSSSETLSTGAIIGIAAGGAAFLGIVYYVVSSRNAAPVITAPVAAAVPMQQLSQQQQPYYYYSAPVPPPSAAVNSQGYYPPPPSNSTGYQPLQPQSRPPPREHIPSDW